MLNDQARHGNCELRAGTSGRIREEEKKGGDGGEMSTLMKK